MKLARHIAIIVLKTPIFIYRYTISPFTGASCRHLPTCSDYASNAIDLNGAWKGGWLALSRILRCNPWGTHGYDPVPDLRMVSQPHWAPWRFGRWSGKHIDLSFDKPPSDTPDPSARDEL